MSVRDEIRDFLLSRRARISPEEAGLPRHGERRVAGLRREEVAQLAGVSVEYYTRLERGNARGYSDDVLAAVARALHLDDAEREHLFDLVHAANARSRPAPDRPLRPGVRRLLDAMTGTPAYVWNSRLDILAANTLARALFAPLFDSPFQPVNQARFLFRDESAPGFFPEWELMTHDAVAVLRTATGRNPEDERLSALVSELLAAGGAFRSLWAAYDVRHRRTGRKHFQHPVAGPLTVDFESMALVGHPGLRLSAGTAEPGSASEQALQFLANWSTTPIEEGHR
ncbi:helix-turn-helix domain-containing protein [Actinoplanes derwentensis]|uniref:Helix-turn-helix domain-containing protein n=1 Tax=Actinoplanes derwentensis TaxID=113562 RepID=A0A1H1T7N4_9ACTN|nr:helix-turn-helix transcriptional regulator [Actinoplanes derwentensis]GID89009.1 transcriptional regulator [Actinoplanes derwentensis]SDS56222.1 Helix-turn-helix domain-containing protein [Actinoplanes derwentensis]